MRPALPVIRVATAACTLLAATGFAPAQAATALDKAKELCLGETTSLDDRMNGCTALIDTRAVSGHDLAIALCNRAYVLTEKRQYQRAVADLDAGLKIDRAFECLYVNRGRALGFLGELDKEIANYDQAIRVDPKSALAYNNRGDAWRRKGDLDRAIADLTAAIRLDPDLAVAYDNRGATWRAKGDLDRSLADFNAAIRLDPKNASLYNKRGTTRLAKGDFDRAIADLTDAIRLDPEDAGQYNNRGIAQRAKGDIDGAIADYTEAIRLDPEAASAYRNRGELFFTNGDFAKASGDLLRANTLTDNVYTVLWRYLAQGRLKQDGAAELAANAARLKSREWPYAVIDFYLGRRTLAEMRSAATKSDEKCEAEFYAGQWQLLHDKPADARAALRTAADSCPKSFIEYGGAVAELKRLDG
jgi:tetratricopeptide (TPR) repeat protein